jgi:hypothetical protein
MTTQTLRPATDYPVSIEHAGRTWYRTDKIGTMIATGEPAAEYSAHAPGLEFRLWLTIGGTITED